MLTQKIIIETIKTNSLLTPNPKDSFLIIDIFNLIDRSENYSFKFQKTQEYWTSADWKVVATDVQKSINFYKSK